MLSRMFISLQLHGSYRYPFDSIHYSTTLTILMYALRGFEEPIATFKCPHGAYGRSRA